MNNDNPTRIISGNRNTSVPADGATRRINADDTAAKGGAASSHADDDAPKTRVISSHGSGSTAADPADKLFEDFELAAGWLVIVSGPGRGVTREIYYGMNSIGRGSNERISLDFGDNTISREAHAYIVFDEKQNDFYVQHGGKSNLVRLNDSPVLAPQQLKKGDIIEIGGTKMMFVPLCGDDFSWNHPVD